ncbi:MAG: ABC transporter ATP-binding protein [Rhodobacteraceae bacterium]|nr:ABC transporter ATP-binding protein [Paracoccaceae bacterium]MCY4249442.1 ABC transporter ATP-binding protein [Paracoccaceae bacterium]
MALLKTQDLTAFYGNFQALFGINITLNQNETLAIIGANGAGKSSLLRSISGVLKSPSESILLDDKPIGHLDADEITSLGIAMIPEGRRLFPSLNVEENLMIGAHGKKQTGYWNLNNVYDLFPALKEKHNQPGTSLSGGEQQMVAMGRALMSNPRLLLCDEISLGLAPVVIKNLYEAFPKIKKCGASLIIVEQDIVQAMKVSDRVCCMMEGKITLSGRPDDLSMGMIHAAYFGEEES